MATGLSVICTVRGNEPKLVNTLYNARETAGCPVEIVVVYDGTEANADIPADQILAHRAARGIGPSRHKGIEAAKYPVVLLIDAHMNFEPGYGKKILAHFANKKHHKDVTCGRCIPSMSDLSPMAGSTGYTGARFSWKTHETGGEYWALSGKWSDQQPGEIGCVFGACYAMRKSWYKKLGEPLQLLRGWWGDEEYLSMSSWLAGGRCVLLDYWCSHLFRDTPSFVYTRDDWMFPQLNRHRLIDLFPCDAEMKDDLLKWLSASIRSSDADFVAMRAQDIIRPEVEAAKAVWAGWANSVKAFIFKWVDLDEKPLSERLAMRDVARPWKNEATTPETPQAPQVQQRSYLVCPNCGRRNTFRVDRTANRNGGVVRYGKCSEHSCGIRGVMIDRNESQVMHWGRDAEVF